MSKLKNIKIRKEYCKDAFDLELQNNNITTLEDLVKKAYKILSLPNELNHCFDPNREEVENIRDLDMFEDGSIFIVTSDTDTTSKYESEEAIKVREEERCRSLSSKCVEINNGNNNNSTTDFKRKINDNNNDTNNYIELEGKKPKRIGVWKCFVTIHGYYDDDDTNNNNGRGDGELKPGKRMCLTQKQWKQFKESIDKIDQMILDNQNTDHY